LVGWFLDPTQAKPIWLNKEFGSRILISFIVVLVLHWLFGLDQDLSISLNMDIEACSRRFLPALWDCATPSPSPKEIYFPKQKSE